MSETFERRIKLTLFVSCVKTDLVDDCGHCPACSDKLKFGGQNTRRQRCVQKGSTGYIGAVHTHACLSVQGELREIPPMLQAATRGGKDALPLVYGFRRTPRARPLAPAIVIMHHCEGLVAFDHSFLAPSLERQCNSRKAKHSRGPTSAASTPDESIATEKDEVCLCADKRGFEYLITACESLQGTEHSLNRFGLSMPQEATGRKSDAVDDAAGEDASGDTSEVSTAARQLLAIHHAPLDVSAEPNGWLRDEDGSIVDSEEGYKWWREYTPAGMHKRGVCSNSPAAQLLELSHSTLGLQPVAMPFALHQLHPSSPPLLPFSATPLSALVSPPSPPPKLLSPRLSQERAEAAALSRSPSLQTSARSSKRSRECAAPGCSLPDKHAGVCSHLQGLQGKRSRRPKWLGDAFVLLD